uniref:LamG-like jellyroll fold domain-containing protein n=1 Tax=Mariniflexile sp. TaxID=1979402 RepID=UPI0040479353
MGKSLSINVLRAVIFVFFLCSGYHVAAQVAKVEIIGGGTIINNTTTTITAGTSLNFRITNTEAGNCDVLEIQSIAITNTPAFSLTPTSVSGDVRPTSCAQWWWVFFGYKTYLDFKVQNNSASCSTASTVVSIKIKGIVTPFKFTLAVNSSPKINVLGGSPLADIFPASIPKASNGTYFGAVEVGATVTRNYIIANTGSCPLNITAVNITAGDFNVVPSSFTATIASGSSTVMPIKFAPSGAPGTRTATVSIVNSDAANTPFTFNVSAEVFNFNIPGPGGVTADFRLWLKATRGVTRDVNSKVFKWADLGANPKDASQLTPANQPTYFDAVASNINFNPVIKFENNGSSISQYLENTVNGFFSQDIFIVMQPDVDVTTLTSGMTIFSGSISDLTASGGYTDDVNDVTGVGLGEYRTNLTGEKLWYNQGSSTTTNKYYALPAASRTYNLPGIINAGNKTTTVSDGMRIIYNGILDAVAPVTNVAPFQNVGYVNTGVVYGTPYNIGKNKNKPLGNLNGRVAEIFTFANRLSDADRNKVESYLAIKYGITLGSTTVASKNYINSFASNNIVWSITSNAGFNFDVAGIGRDDASDLNQKQSRTVNRTNEVTIGLGGIFDKNSLNPNEFTQNGDFLVWGNNQLPFTGSTTSNIDLGAGITSTLTRIDRKWKIVETNQSGGDVGNVYISIPKTALTIPGFTIATNEEYVLIVSQTENFNDIRDVIPLRPDGAGNLYNWYNFDSTKFFTFGKVAKIQGKHAATLGPNEYLLGDYALNLNPNDFTISAWVKADASQTTGFRNVMSKGEKLQMRLNASHKVQIVIDGAIRFTSTMGLDDNKWHQITFVYDSGTVFLYIDGVLDKSEQNVLAPSPNFNNYCIGALYINNASVSNFFLGQIDEVYIWDQGLTRDQVRYLMNQEIERTAANKVSGKIIPFSASSNEVKTIDWSKLRVYYDFNSFYGTTVEGQANVQNSTTDRYFIRINYLSNNKDVLSTQTAPLPYVSVASLAWDNPNTWKNGADQMIPNALSLNGVRRVDWNIAKISHDITSGDNDIALLGLVQTAGKLTIANPSELEDENNSGHGLAISHYLEMDGVIDLVGESQLLQSEGSIIDADSGGYIERDQQGTANGFNYNYWSSSVGPIGGNVAGLGTGVSSENASNKIEDFLNNGTQSSSYTSFLFDDVAYNIPPPTGPPGLIRTIFTYWLYKFNGPADSYDDWIKIDEKSYLLAGEGFTMKGPLGTAPISMKQNYVFKGLPNNGDITLPLIKNITGTNPSGNVERLVGNPYPSAIDANEFILDNISIADGGTNTNGTVINGALYFWDHFGPANSHYLKEYIGGYATRNLTGGAAAISNDIRINNTSNGGNPDEGTKVPGQYIPLNQGFFVNTTLAANPNNSDPVSPIATVDGGNIVFKNSQRVFVTELEESSGVPISVFMKSAKGKTANKMTNNNFKDNTPTIRLMYDSPSGYHRQIVLGANTNASNNFDLGYDAFMLDVNVEDMYWNLNNSKFVIQGVADFNTSQEFPLGLIVKNSGIAKIRVDVLENVPNSQDIYIKDESTQETYKINNNNTFEVYLQKGTYNDRFKMVFQSSQDQSLDMEDVKMDDVFIYYDANTSDIKVVNKTSLNLSTIFLYNLLGQEVKKLKLNTTSDAVMPVSVSTGAYIVKLNTAKGTVNKKIIID